MTRDKDSFFGTGDGLSRPYVRMETILAYRSCEEGPLGWVCHDSWTFRGQTEKANATRSLEIVDSMEAAIGIEPMNKGFAGLAVQFLRVTSTCFKYGLVSFFLEMSFI